MKPRTKSGKKNITGARIKELREKRKLSQRNFAVELQRAGLDVDKNVITRIETNKRSVMDFELKIIANYFNVSYECLIDGVEEGRKIDKLTL